MAATTFRQASIAQIMGVLNARVADAPSATQVAAAYRIRPRSTTSPTPYAYIGDWTETVRHSTSLRFREAKTSVVLATRLKPVPSETMGELDVLTDTLMDDLTAAGFATAYPSILPAGVEAGEDSEPDGGAQLELVVINLTALIQEGRP